MRYQRSHTLTVKATTDMPTPAIPTLAHRLKDCTAYAVRREHTRHCVHARMRGHLWPPSYFAASCRGAPLSIIKHYIDSQARPR
jgi:putative transposase